MGKQLTLTIGCVVYFAIHAPAQQIGTSDDPPDSDISAESDVIRYERELANRLVDVTKAEQGEATQFPFVWCALRYNLTFESNWERARELILETLRSEPEITDTARQANDYFAAMSASFSIKVDPPEPVVRCWTSGVGVELTARFLAHPRRRPHLIDMVNLKILRTITQSDDIRFAYWTIRSISTPQTEKTLPQKQQDVSQELFPNNISTVANTEG